MKTAKNIHIPVRLLLLMVIYILHSSFFALHSSAQSNDPGLAALVEAYKMKAERMYKAQDAVQLLESTNHIWLNSETKAVYNLQKEFNDYISTFRNVVCYAAQIYGFYYEIDNLVSNMTTMSQQISSSPANPFAVALSDRRNDIYIEIIQTASGIINNVREACVGPKMTEKERVELIFDIRPRLQKLNAQLRRLNKFCKYTNMTDVWREIVGRTRVRNDKSDIIRQSFSDWRSNGHKIKP